MVAVRGYVAQSNTDNVVQRLERNARTLKNNVGSYIYSTAVSTSPVRSGRMRDSHTLTTKQDGTVEVKVGAYYGVYVNYGTRYQHAQPWFSQSVAQGRQKLSYETTRLFK